MLARQKKERRGEGKGREASTQCESQYLPGTEWQANWGATLHNSSLLSLPAAGRQGRRGEGRVACQRVAATGSAPSLASAVSHTKPSVALAAVSGAQKVDIGHPQPLFTCWLALKPLLLAISMCATKLLLIFRAELQQQRQGKKGGCPLILRRLATTAILFYALAIKLQFFGANLSKNI